MCQTVWSTAEVPAGLYESIYSADPPVVFYDRYQRYARSVARRRRPLRYLALQEDVYFAVDQIVQRQALAASAPPAFRIAEVGSGLGYVTAALRSEGFDCVGLDISEAAVERSRRRFGGAYKQADILQPAQEDIGAYDLVILLEVIEHVPDPVVFLRSLRRLLAPGGSLLLTTPDRDIYPPGVIWKSDLPPVHLYWFNRTSVKALASTCHMSADFMSFRPFNHRRYQVVPARGQIAPDKPYLTHDLKAVGAPGHVHRLMEHVRQVPALANMARRLATTGRSYRRLDEQSFSLAAVLTPLEGGADGSD